MVSTPIELAAGLAVGHAKLRPALSGKLAHEERRHRADRLLAANAVFTATAVAALAVTAGDSVVMRAALIATLVGVVPPMTFLIASRLERHPPSTDYPAGLHRLSAAVYLCGALALIVAGAHLAIAGTAALVAGAAATGDGAASWAMLAAAVYAGVLPVLFAPIKRRIAEQLHDKSIHADARRDASGWRLPAVVALAIAGTAVGWWWADPIAALLLAVALLGDGRRQLRDALTALIERLPMRTDLAGLDPALGVVLGELAATPWVTTFELRLREHGPLIAGDVLVTVPPELRVAELAALTVRLRRADWRLAPITVAPLITPLRAALR